MDSSNRYVPILLLSAIVIAAGCTPNDHSATDSPPISPYPQGIDPGPIRHPNLTTKQTRQIRGLQSTFAEVDPSSPEAWIDDFKRDDNVDHEIGIYEEMARVYRAYCSIRTLTPAQKHDLYAIVIMRSEESGEQVLAQAKMESLQNDDIKAILALYNSAPSPIVISPAHPASP